MSRELSASEPKQLVFAGLGSSHFTNPCIVYFNIHWSYDVAHGTIHMSPKLKLPMLSMAGGNH